MKGKYAAKAALHQSVQSREAELAIARPRIERLERELREAKARIADYQTKLGAWSAEREEMIQRQIAETLRKAGEVAGVRAGIQEGYEAGQLNGLAIRAYELHLMADHDMGEQEAKWKAEKEAREVNGSLSRVVRRKSAARTQRRTQRMAKDAVIFMERRDEDPA